MKDTTPANVLLYTFQVRRLESTYSLINLKLFFINIEWWRRSVEWRNATDLSTFPSASDRDEAAALIEPSCYIRSFCCVALYWLLLLLLLILTKLVSKWFRNWFFQTLPDSNWFYLILSDSIESRALKIIIFIFTMMIIIIFPLVIGKTTKRTLPLSTAFYRFLHGSSH